MNIKYYYDLIRELTNDINYVEFTNDGIYTQLFYKGVNYIIKKIYNIDTILIISNNASSIIFDNDIIFLFTNDYIKLNLKSDNYFHINYDWTIETNLKDIFIPTSIEEINDEFIFYMKLSNII